MLPFYLYKGLYVRIEEEKISSFFIVFLDVNVIIFKTFNK